HREVKVDEHHQVLRVRRAVRLQLHELRAVDESILDAARVRADLERHVDRAALVALELPHARQIVGERAAVRARARSRLAPALDRGAEALSARVERAERLELEALQRLRARGRRAADPEAVRARLLLRGEAAHDARLAALRERPGGALELRL